MALTTSLPLAEPAADNGAVTKNAEGMLVFTIASGNKTVSLPAVKLPKPDEFAVNQEIRFQCEYRTAGYSGQGVGLNIRIFSDGKAIGALYPANRVRGDRFGYLFNASESWKKVDIKLNFIGRACDSAALELTSAVSSGQLEMRGIKLELISKLEHRISGGKYNIGLRNLEHVFLADRGTLNIRFSGAFGAAAGVKIYNAEGKLLSTRNTKVSDSDFALELPGRGFFMIEAFSENPNGEKVVTMRPAAVLGTPEPAQSRKRSRYGLMVVNGSMSLAANLGARWDWRFYHMENVKSPDEITPVKQFMTLPPEQGVIYAGGYSAPVPGCLNSQAGKFYPPADWNVYAKVVEDWAASQQNSAEFLCVFNEPDFQWKGTHEELVKVHKVFADAVRKARPKIKVLGPAASRLHMNFMRSMDKYNLFDSLDGIVMHAYVDGTAPEGEFYSKSREFFDYLKATGKDSMPVYFTEFGWSTEEGTWQKPVDELTQARYLIRSMALLATEKLEAVVWFCDFYNTRNRGEAGFGMMKLEPDRIVPKPIMAAYATLTRNLSDLKGQARLWRFTPDLYCITGKRSKDQVAVVWHTSEAQNLKFPVPVSGVEGAFGENIEVKEGEIRISPSPVFISLPDEKFTSMQTLEPQMRYWGEKIVPEGSLVWFPAEFTASGKALELPFELKIGPYLVLTQKDSQLTAQPIEVRSPLVLAGSGEAWKPGKTPELTLQFNSHFRSVVSAKLQLPDGREQPVKIIPGENALSIPVVGNHLEGKITLFVPAQPGVGKSFALSDMVSKYFFNLQAKAYPNWRQIIPEKFNLWKDSRGKTVSKTADCSAEVYGRYSKDALELKIVVTDNEFNQPYTQERMWQGDSIQLAFDVDADKEWEANNMSYGFNGHRVFEYCAGLTSAGPEVFRQRAFAPDIPPDVPAPGVGAKISLNGNIITYELRFPWREFGLNSAPAAGARIGFALAVNDLDSGVREAMCLFGGIVESKDPTRFGKIYLQ